MGGGGRRRIAETAFSALIALVAIVATAAALGWRLMYAPGPAKAETVVVLKPGSGVREMARALKAAHVIRSPAMFRLAAKLHGADRRLKAGEYAFGPGETLKGVLARIAAGKVVRHWVTLPEGRTSAQALAIVRANPVLSGEARLPPEGSLLPDTYEVLRGDSRQEVLDRMMRAQQALLSDLWSKRHADAPFRTPYEAVILASIVEKETGLAKERSRVAAVYLNRVKKGMRLEADPTIIYGISRGEPLGRGIRLSELTAPGPYNTYLNAGLPPTPIANPGREALESVLKPPVSRDIFFVADGTGGHAFSETFEDHQRKVARWREIEAAKTLRPARLAP